MDTNKEKESRDINSGIIAEVEAMDFADCFSVEEISESELSKAKKIPITSLALLGTAFGELPEVARAIVTTVTGETMMKDLYVGIRPAQATEEMAYKDGVTWGHFMRKTD